VRFTTPRCHFRVVACGSSLTQVHNTRNNKEYIHANKVHNKTLHNTTSSQHNTRYRKRNIDTEDDQLKKKPCVEADDCLPEILEAIEVKFR
jgi:ribosomal protein S4E